RNLNSVYDTTSSPLPSRERKSAALATSGLAVRQLQLAHVRSFPCAAIAVRQLQLANFRSYTSAEIAVSGGPVVLAGPNGAGKTNLLEAISLLAPGRGMRAAALSEHTRKGPAPAGPLWAVSAVVQRGGESHDIGTGLEASGSSTSRQVRLNGARAQNSADLSELIQMAWLTPAMDRLFIESASGRRRFLDRLTPGFSPSHRKAAARS